MTPFSPAAGATVNIDVAATTAQIQVTTGSGGLGQVRVMNNGARAAYTPTSGETFAPTLEIIQD